MRESPHGSRLLLGILLSGSLHAAVALLVASGVAPPPEPKPWILASFSNLTSLSIDHLSEGVRLTCASFPALCEQEKLVALDVALSAEEEPTPDAPPPPDKIAALLPDRPQVLPEPPKVPPPQVPPIEVKPPEEKKPEEKKPDQNLALVPTPPPPPVIPKERKKSVEQVVEKEDKDNPNAHFLSDTTHVAAEETQARTTSDHIMDKESGGDSDQNAPPDENPGSDKPKVAGVEDKQSSPTDTKHAVRKENEVPPVAQVTAPPGQEKEGKKGLSGDPHEVTDGPSETAAPKVTSGNNGNEDAKGKKGEGTGSRSDPGGKKGQQNRFTLTMNDYEQLYGKTEGAAKGQEDEKSFGKGGKAAKRKKFVMAQLENYLPEVKPGNQTSLSTAADPFAKFLHQAHLRIHKQWGDGTLRDFDGLGGTNPLNNPTLQVTLEIVVNPDGTLEKAAPIGSSGYLPYDVAAVTAVYDAAPFPKPPESIKSYNGKVYLRWTLHRDNRQCATSFAEPYILTGGGNGAASQPTEKSTATQPPSGGDDKHL